MYKVNDRKLRKGLKYLQAWELRDQNTQMTFNYEISKPDGCFSRRVTFVKFEHVRWR